MTRNVVLRWISARSPRLFFRSFRPALAALALSTLLSVPLAATPSSLVFSTYLGGGGQDASSAVAADAEGNTYVAGWTQSADFPLTDGSTNPWYQESVLVKFGPSGELLWSTYFGGSRGEGIYDIAVDAAGFLYVAGYSFSPEFPAVNSVPPELLQHHQGFFVSKLEPDGDIVFTAKMSGPSASGRVEDLAVDSQGFVYLLGFTSNGDFPTWRAVQPAFGGGSMDLVVVKLDPNGGLVYSTYLGGDNSESAGAIAADAQGNAYVTGSTHSANFPLVRKLAMPSPTVWRNQAFVTKLSPDGSSLVYSTFFGGKGGSENAFDLAVDAAGNAYVAGATNTPDFPVRNALQPVLRGSADAFLVKLSPQPALLYATYFGGSHDDTWEAISLGADGRIHATGTTQSPDYPLVEPLDDECGPVDAAGRCHDEVVVTTLDPTLYEALFSTFLGGSIPLGTNRADERGADIAVDPAGELHLAGSTYSTDFPTASAFQSTHAGGNPGSAVDLFVTRMRISTVFNRPPDCSAATASPSSVWPPDRRQVRISTLGVTDPDGDPVALEVTRIFQDELSTVQAPDAGDLGTARPWVRADRMESGDGRVYHLFFEAADPAGRTCVGEVEVCVPLASGGSCGDGGARIDSTLVR